MYWADAIAQEIIKSGKYQPYWVDDMKTPSGRVHIGSVRAVFSHYLIYRALKDAGVPVTFSYVLEDQDPFDKIPHYIDSEKYTEHLGKQLCDVPSPYAKDKSYGEHWGQEYIDIFNSIGVYPEVIWGSKLYKTGMMNETIRIALDKADVIRGIYETLYGKRKANDWFPFNIKCEKCGKIATTKVTSWDGIQVAYECTNNVVDYTTGCGYVGSRSPFDGAGKMPWKVEWACKWMAIGVTVEGAGKDHMSDGGSHDFAKLMCKHVLPYELPYGFLHEFFLIGGRKMSSSKGVGSSAREVAEILPPELLRFLVARVPLNKAINFDPQGDTIPDLFDAYDTCAQAYWKHKNAKQARIFVLAQLNEVPAEHFLPRFRDVSRIMQDPKCNLFEEFAKIKGTELNSIEKEEIKKRSKYAQIWLDAYAPKEEVIAITDTLPEEAKTLKKTQLEFLEKVKVLLESEWSDTQELQQKLYLTGKELGLQGKETFSSLYLVLLGRTYGPKAAWFILENREAVIKRLDEVSNLADLQ